MISRNGIKIKPIDIKNAANSYKHQMEYAKLKVRDVEDGQLTKALNYLMNCAVKGAKPGPFDVDEPTKSL